MKNQMIWMSFALMAILLSCQAKTDKLSLLFDTMRGNFSSAAQAETDSTYYEIHLKMKPIWNMRQDGYWLYVEQSVAGWQHKPYRQRVYHLSKGEKDTLISEVYELSNPQKVIGACDEMQLLNGLTPDSLIKREGCAIFLT
ncbi:MAG TPA: hypothetical protein ENN84_00045, partial [Candidatus Marinimicrobia bacterium]|nr:hypothetical protein [Candidatus Neomarinimicrobiota bacterium]